VSGAVPEGTKCCTKCGETKPLDDFSKRAASPDGKRSQCKPCSNIAARQWVANNQAVRAAYLSSYHQANRQRRNALASNYYQSHRQESAARTSKRRALLREGAHTPYSRAEIFTRWGGWCCYCDAPAEHLDHVHALSRGGADAAHNLVPACAPCNLAKGAKTLAEWALSWLA
jgi:5-methylcytosine-specific restriction endonuclease McrA